MLLYEDFHETAQVQATIFTPGLIFSTSEILKKLINLEQNLFDGNPFVLPLPDDAPMDIPRITLENKKKTFKLEVAPNRMNFFRNKVDNEDKVKIDEFIQTASQILTELLEKINVNCGRIAIVINRFAIKDNPAKEIVLHFCEDNFMKEPFDRPSEFEIHSLKKYTFLEKYEVNSWVRIRSGHLQYEKGIIKSVINVQQDINTIAEETRSYSSEEIIKFYNNIHDEFNKILKLYFKK